jgi:hypothetical protein
VILSTTDWVCETRHTLSTHSAARRTAVRTRHPTPTRRIGRRPAPTRKSLSVNASESCSPSETAV